MKVLEEVADDLSSQVLVSGLVMVEESLVGSDDHVSELSGGEDLGKDLLVVRERHVEVGRDDSALVESSIELNDNFASSLVIDNLEVIDVS